jgi:glycosyltransferase involved in cell wall biosynthesis
VHDLPREVWLLDHSEILGGGQLFGLDLTVALREQDCKVVIGCDPGSPLAERSRSAEIPTADLRFPALGPRNALPVATATRRTRRFLRGLGRESLVIGNHPRVHAYLFAARRRRGGPAIVNVVHEQHTASRPFARYAYRRFGALAVVGANAARAYEEKLPGVPVTKVSNFLPVDYFSGARARSDHGPRFEGRLGVLARLIPEKGVLELIDELADNAARGAWKELLLGGPAQDPAYVNAVKDRIAFHGLEDRIRLLGEVDDVPAFLADVDALVMPSTGSEAQGRVIIEGLAHAVPAIVREHIYSADFERLPVTPYRGPRELGEALRRLPYEPAQVQELIRRFGPEQAIEGIAAAAQLARARS